MLDEMLDEAGGSLLDSLCPEGWSTDGFGDESIFICPHGERVEQDGRCPEGCVSPLLRMGLI